MADNYLITGYWGEPHVTVENDRGFNAAVFGTGKFVLPVGEMFRAEYIGNNIVRIYDGKLIDNGAVAGIPAGEYIEFSIPEAGQGMKRNDLIIFEYSRNDSTLVESGVFKVIPGVEANETAVDPVLTENNLLSNIASFDQMALWRVPVSGAVISAPEILYNTRFAGERIANVTSTDGKVYTANLPGVAKLYNGLEIIIIPDITSTTTLPSLNINGLGDVNIKRRITSNTRTTVQSEDENFLYKDQPIRLIYNGSAWVADMARANVNDLYGAVPVEKGGTGADNAEEACENLGAQPVSTALKVAQGSYKGTGTTGTKTIEFDFKPLFVMVRERIQNSTPVWFVNGNPATYFNPEFTQFAYVYLQVKWNGNNLSWHVDADYSWVYSSYGADPFDGTKKQNISVTAKHNLNLATSTYEWIAFGV